MGGCPRFSAGEEVAAGTAAIVSRLREMRPNAKVLLLGCFPTGASPDSWERRQVNVLHERIAQLADGDRVLYQDLRGLFLNPDGSISHTTMSGDDVHLAAPGYGAWGEAILPTIRRMVDGAAE